MSVAKSYQDSPILCEPYIKNKRKYVKINYRGAEKEVRWYDSGSSETSLGKKIRPVKEVLGFSKGYITIFKGNTYALLDWFRESPAHYHNLFGWYFISDEPLPAIIPEGIKPVELRWEDVSLSGEDALKPDSAIKEHIESLIYEPTGSEFQGEVGDRIDRTLTVTKVIDLETGYYGPSTFHLFIDEAGNEYSWITSSKRLEEGETYAIRGTVKEHKVYHNSKQTVLTRCVIKE